MKSLSFSSKTSDLTAKKVHRLQPNHTRQELRQQPIRQLDYVLDLDSPTADGFPLVIFPFQGSNMQFTGDFEIRFSVIKNGEKGKYATSAYQEKLPPIKLSFRTPFLTIQGHNPKCPYLKQINENTKLTSKTRCGQSL